MEGRVGVLTKEAVDDAKQATHGADDGRDDIILSLNLQAAGVDLNHACLCPIRAQPRGVCHSGQMSEGVGCFKFGMRVKLAIVLS